MDFSTRTVEEISTLLAKEMGRLIEEQQVHNAVELENGIREMVKGIGQRSYEKVLEQEDQKQGGSMRCVCGAKAKRISRRKAKILTVFGWASYGRSYYGCAGCGQKTCPVDQRWELNPGEVSGVLGELLAILGVEMAFERASLTIVSFLLLEVSDNTIRKQTQAVGERQAQMEAQWIGNSLDEVWLQQRQRNLPQPPQRLYGSLDGAQVPVGTEWRELKTLCWYEVGRVYGQEKPTAQQISYHSDITSAQEFGELVWATGVQRLADQAEEVIFVCDGAVWIWKLVEQYFPKAIQIVDWYHACAYLTPIAEAAFNQTEERQDWLEKVKEDLWQGNLARVIAACQPDLFPAVAREAAGRAVTYFTHNQQRMAYAEYREKGYWIGSGTVESACKQIATARLKIAGARWTLSGVVATAKARAAWLSEGKGFHTLADLPLAG